MICHVGESGTDSYLRCKANSIICSVATWQVKNSGYPIGIDVKINNFDRMLSGVFFMICFATSFDSCILMEAEEFHSALKQAVHSLLKAHEMCTT